MASQPPPPSKKLPPLSILAAVGGSKKESTPTQSKSNESAPTTDSNAGIPPAAAKPPPLHQDNNNNKNNNPPATSGGYESMNSNSSGSGGSLPKKRVKPPCSVPTCTNRAVQGGKCITHGAKRPLCKHPGCEKAVKSKGFCSGHGPKRKTCDVPDCTKVAVQGGKCIKHGAKRSNDKYTQNDGDCIGHEEKGGFSKRHNDAELLEDANLLSNLYYSSAASDSSGGEGEMEDAPMSNSQKKSNNNNDSSLLDDCKMGGVDDSSPSTKPKPMQVDEPSKPKPNPSNDEAISSPSKWGASTAYGYWGGSVVAVPRLPPKSYNPDPHPLQSYKPSPVRNLGEINSPSPSDEAGEESDESHQLDNNSDDDDEVGKTEPDDSAFAAATMLRMSGSRSSSPAENLKEDAIATKDLATKEVAKSPAKTSNLMSNLAPEECPISPQFKAMKGTTPPRSYYTFVPNANDPKTPPKKQIKFNVGGTIVQVPSGILLKYEQSKLASMARSALRMDVAVPIPRQFDMFSHCVFYLCNDKVHLPSSIRRKAFMKEMEYFGIPYDEKCISGGCSSPNKSTSSSSSIHTSHQNLPVTQQLATPSSSGTLNQKPNIVTGHKDAAAGGPTKPSSPSSLDLEPSTTRRSSRAGKDSPAATVPQQPGSDSKKSRPCGECEGCLHDDCGECPNCKDKKKFGGPNKLRQKCSKRYCSNMIRPGDADPSPRSDDAAVDKLEEKKKKKKDAQPNLSVLAAEKRWAENLMLLRPCIEEGGLINYANISNPEVRNRIKNYVKEQRRQFRRMENGESTSLTKERLVQLEEARFPKSHKKTPFKMTNPEPEAPTSAISAALAELGLKKRPTLSTLKPNSSSLDLLCSITSQTFDNEIDGGSWSSGVFEEELANGSSTPLKKGMKTKGSCGACAKCLREDCGACRACLDKTKYGGPNTMRQRCYERRCMNKVDRHPPPVVKVKTPGSDSNGFRSEEARMKAELAKIKAELDAKARGHNYGMKIKNKSNLMTRSSRRSFEELSRQYEGSEEDVDSDDEIMDTSDEDSTIMDSEADSDADSDDEIIDDERFATSKDSVSAPPRGVSVRPSGKWQVQLSYAGCSRYIGLFDSKDEATTAYKLAKQCRKELDDDDPPTHRVKANLDLMRKAAFSQYSSSDNESSSSLEEEEEEEEYSSSRRRANRQERKQNNKKTSDGAPRRGPGRPLGSYKKGKPRPVKSSRGRGRPLGSTNKKKAAGTKKAADDDRTSTVSKRKPPPETTNRYAKSYARPRREAPKPPPPAPVPKSARIQKKRAAAAAPKKEAAKVQDYNLPKLNINPEILEAAKQVAESLPRGITVRPSGKWQVQLYYLGKSRYIGVFDSKTDAAIGYELARSCVESFKDENPGVDQIKKNIALMRKAAYSDVSELLKHTHGNKKRKTEAKPTAAAAVSRVVEEKKEAPKALPKLSDRSARASKRSIDEIADAKSDEPAAKIRATTEAKNERAREVAKNVETKKPPVAPPTPDPVLSSLPNNAEKIVGVVEHLMNSKVPLDELREKGRDDCKDICRPADILFGNQFWQDIRSLLSDAIDAAEKGETVDRGSLFRIYASSSLSNAKPAAKASSATRPKTIQTQVQPTATASTELTFATGEAAAAHQLSQAPRPGRTEDLVEVGPGWKVNIVPRVGGDRSDFYYFSPTGERFRSLKQAKAAHDKGSVQLGAVGYKFRKNFSDDSGNELGWFDGEVVEILAGTDKRKCLYAEDGYVEELSLAELQELRELESKSLSNKLAHIEPKVSSFGSVGHKFSKQFPDGRWFDGVVVEVLTNVGKKDRRCHYPEDDDFEDLSVADLRRLAELEKNKMEAVLFTHNDLCECCGEAGELLCCATCNLVYHFGCYPNMTVEPPDDWSCAFCVADSKKAGKQAIQQARATVKEIEGMKNEARKKKKTYQGGSSKKACSFEGCIFKMHKGGFCRKHGEQHAETCRVKDCQNIWCLNKRKAK